MVQGPKRMMAWEAGEGGATAAREGGEAAKAEGEGKEGGEGREDCCMHAAGCCMVAAAGCCMGAAAGCIGAAAGCMVVAAGCMGAIAGRQEETRRWEGTGKHLACAGRAVARWQAERAAGARFAESGEGLGSSHQEGFQELGLADSDETWTAATGTTRGTML